jgi:hypothetical protein
VNLYPNPTAPLIPLFRCSAIRKICFRFYQSSNILTIQPNHLLLEASCRLRRIHSELVSSLLDFYFYTARRADAVIVTCYPHAVRNLFTKHGKGVPKKFYKEVMKPHFALLHSCQTKEQFCQLKTLIVHEWTQTAQYKGDDGWTELQKLSLKAATGTLDTQYFSYPWDTWFITACGLSGATPDNNALEAWNNWLKEVGWVRKRASLDTTLHALMKEFLKQQGDRFSGGISWIALGGDGTPIRYANEIHVASLLVEEGLLRSVCEDGTAGAQTSWLVNTRPGGEEITAERIKQYQVALLGKMALHRAPHGVSAAIGKLGPAKRLMSVVEYQQECMGLQRVVFKPFRARTAAIPDAPCWMRPQAGALLHGTDAATAPGWFHCTCSTFAHHCTCEHTYAVRGYDKDKPFYVDLSAEVQDVAADAKRKREKKQVGGAVPGSGGAAGKAGAAKKPRAASIAATGGSHPAATAGMARPSWWRVEGGGGDTARVDAALAAGDGSEVLAVASTAAAIEFKKAANPSAIPLSTTCILPLKRFSRSTN